MLLLLIVFFFGSKDHLGLCGELFFAFYDMITEEKVETILQGLQGDVEVPV